jgi:hypothetical protein
VAKAGSANLDQKYQKEQDNTIARQNQDRQKERAAAGAGKADG